MVFLMLKHLVFLQLKSNLLLGILFKYQTDFVRNGPPDAGWFQQQLKRVGYAVPENGYFDQKTLAVIAAFQAHYRPALVTGKPDAQTAARLQALPTSGSGL